MEGKCTFMQLFLFYTMMKKRDKIEWTIKDTHTMED